MNNRFWIILFLLSTSSFSQGIDSSFVSDCDDAVGYYKYFFGMTVKDEFETTDEYNSRLESSILLPIEKCFCADVWTSEYDADKEEYEVSLSIEANGELIFSSRLVEIDLGRVEVLEGWGSNSFWNSPEDKRYAECIIGTNDLKLLTSFENSNQHQLIQGTGKDYFGKFNRYGVFINIPLIKARDAKDNIAMKVCVIISNISNREEKNHSISPDNPFMDVFAPKERQEALLAETIKYIIGAEIKSVTFYNRLTKEIYTEYFPKQ